MDSNEFKMEYTTEIPESSSLEEENACVRNHTTLESFQNCIREQALAQLRYMSSTQANIFTFIYAFVSLLGVVGNGLVIFVVLRRPAMRTTRNVFIVNLAVSNFLLALILVPFLWLPTYGIEFSYGAFMCKVAQAFPSTNIVCSALTVSVIAVDRYFVVVRTRLHAEARKFRICLAAAAIWIVSISLSILYLLHFSIKDYVLPFEYIPKRIRTDREKNILLFRRCELQPRPCLELEEEESSQCYKFYETVVSGIMAVFIYIAPMSTLVIFSCLLTRFLAKNERRQSSLRNRVSKKKVFKSCSLEYSEGPRAPPIPIATSSERRRSRTTALLFAMAFGNAILWLPFTVISLYIQLGPSDVKNQMHDELRQLDDAAKLISMLSICVNPFLYGYLNTNFQREFKRIFRQCVPCLSASTSAKDAILLLPASRPFDQAREIDSAVTVYVQRQESMRNCSP